MQACTQNALRIIGEHMSCHDVLQESLRDAPFYEESGGGITLSGGEPTFQSEFSAAILEKAQRAGVHTAVETNGYCAWERIEKLARFTDLFLFDLKIIDRSKSLAAIGADSGVILENLESVDRMGKAIFVRFPLIPGYTDDPDNIEKVIAVAVGLKNVTEVHVLPFHQYGKHKYRALGYPYELETLPPLSRAQVQELMSPYNRKIDIKIFG